MPDLRIIYVPLHDHYNVEPVDGKYCNAMVAHWLVTCPHKILLEISDERLRPLRDSYRAGREPDPHDVFLAKSYNWLMEDLLQEEGGKRCVLNMFGWDLTDAEYEVFNRVGLTDETRSRLRERRVERLLKFIQYGTFVLVMGAAHKAAMREIADRNGWEFEVRKVCACESWPSVPTTARSSAPAEDTDSPSLADAIPRD